MPFESIGIQPLWDVRIRTRMIQFNTHHFKLITITHKNTLLVSYFKGDYMVVINKDHLPIGLGDGDLQINDSLGNVFREIKKYI